MVRARVQKTKVLARNGSHQDSYKDDAEGQNALARISKSVSFN